MLSNIMATQIINVAYRPTDDAIAVESVTYVTREMCRGCVKLDECPQARHNIALIRLATWKELARWN